MREYFRTTYSMESYFEESKLLNLDHKDEVDLFQIPLELDEEEYISQFNNTNYMMFEYRLTDDETTDKMVGYAGFFLYESMQHKGRVQAKQDILFIAKKNRGKGSQFIKYCDTILKKIGVQDVMHCVPACKDWSPIIKRMGYEHLETVYKRSL